MFFIDFICFFIDFIYFLLIFDPFWLHIGGPYLGLALRAPLLVIYCRGCAKYRPISFSGFWMDLAVHFERPHLEQNIYRNLESVVQGRPPPQIPLTVIQSRRASFLGGPLARPFKCRVSSHPVFLRFWPGRILGNRIGSQPSKTFLSSRSPHGFYFFRHRGRTGVIGNNGNYSPVFNIDLARFRHRLPGQRPVWNSFGNRLDSFDRVSGFYQPGSNRRASPNQGINPALHQHGRVINVNHHAFSRRSTEYFRANGKTLIVIECENELS